MLRVGTHFQALCAGGYTHSAVRTQSVHGGIPTQSVGTIERGSMGAIGYDRFSELNDKKLSNSWEQQNE